MNAEASAWLSAVEGLPAVHERLKRVLILNRPAIAVITGQDGPTTLFYCDPPYLHETRVTTDEYGEYEMTPEQHLELLATLDSISGKFMLSGYHSAIYDEWARAAGYTCHEFHIANSASHQATKPVKIECIWVNY
jgi:DNA adenine methylase